MKSYYLSVIFTLGIVSTHAQDKCAQVQADDCENHIKVYHTTWDVVDSFYTFWTKTGTSSPQHLFPFSNPTGKNHNTIFSRAHNADSLKTGISTTAANSIILPDSSFTGMCLSPFNKLKDSTYCATSFGTPLAWGTGLSTLATEIKKSARQYIDTSIQEHEFMLDVPVKGFYMNENFQLSTDYYYPSGQAVKTQYEIRPAVRSYHKPGVENIMARVESEGIYYAVPGDSYEIDLGLYDEDGDSVSMLVTQPYGIRLEQGMSYAESDLHFDEIPFLLYKDTSLSNARPFECTGFYYLKDIHKITFTPTTQGFYNMFVRVIEYRQGVIIGFSDHIIGIQVDDQGKEQPEISAAFDLTSNVFYPKSAALYTCGSQNIKFKVGLKQHNSISGNLDYEVNYHGFDQSNMPSYAIVYNNNSDSITLEFSYATNVADPEWKYITVQARDTNCLVEHGIDAVNYRSFGIYVFGDPSAKYKKSYQICAGDTVYLGNTNGLAQWIPVSGDFTSMSCQACPYPKVWPEVTTMYVSQPPSGFISCGATADTVIVNVISDFDLSIIGDTVICDNSYYADLQAIIQPPVPGLNYRWTPAAFCRPDTIVSTNVTLQSDSGWFFVEVWDDYGCKHAVDSILVTRHEFHPKADISNTEVCESDTLLGTASGGTAYLWSMQGADISCPTCDTTDIIVDLGSISPLNVNISDGKGCSYSEDFVIHVNTKPIADAGKDTTIYDGAIFAIDGSGSSGYSVPQWIPSVYLDYDQSILTEGQFVPSTMDYILYLQMGACFATDTVRVHVIPCVLTPIPSAFIPEGDDKVNTFKPNMRDPDTYIKMRIYNRWGNLVYEEEGVANNFKGWDGKIKGEIQPLATYVYTIEVDCVRLDGTPGHTELKGTFQLMR